MFNELLNKLESSTFISLETTPLHSAEFNSIIEKIDKSNIVSKIDAFSTTDNPLSKLKYNPMFAAIKLQNYFKKPVLSTLSMRDRNKIALQSDLLGCNDFDIRCILALTGDPAKISDQPNVKSVLEGNSNLLLEIINNLNNGYDLANKKFELPPKPIYPFSVINSYAKDMNRLEKKMLTKLNNKSIGIISQPVFDIEHSKILLKHFNNAKIDSKMDKSQLILGFFPITSYNTALFLSKNVPGIFVPEDIIKKLKKAKKISSEEEYKVGFDYSSRVFIEIKKLHPKIHLMAANKFDLLNDIIQN